MTDPAVGDTPGLRERKRLATRRAIQVAAITVVRERGFDATTVDEIARIADISPRTFFNYFTSKEEAIVGDGPEVPEGEARDAFIADRSPIFPAIAQLFSVNITPALHDQEMVVLRRTLMKTNPELGAKRWATIYHFEAQVIDVVTRRLAEEFPELAADPAALAERARLTAFVAIGGMRCAWLTWMDDNGEHATLVERLHETFDLLPQIAATSVRT
ncbi:TetR/AcrR family transcriptional regulator [soil metagenome]